MYSCAGEKHAVLVLCDVQGFRAIYIDFITWCLERYGHFDDVILNWHQAYSIGGATHTVLMIAYMPMRVYVKQLLTYINRSRI